MSWTRGPTRGRTCEVSDARARGAHTPPPGPLTLDPGKAQRRPLPQPPARTPAGRPPRDRSTRPALASPRPALRLRPPPSAPPPAREPRLRAPNPATSPRSLWGTVSLPGGLYFRPGPGRGSTIRESRKRPARRRDDGRCVGPREGPSLAACAPLSPVAALAGTTFPRELCGGRTRPLPAAARGRGWCCRDGSGSLRGAGRGRLDAGSPRGGWGQRARAAPPCRGRQARAGA